eukprot:12312552-Heterocapsa_arctica.AAC.1
MAKRRGVGKVRHLHTTVLCLQQKVFEGIIDIEKEAGETNSADRMTKHLASELMWRHLSSLGYAMRVGHSDIALHVQGLSGYAG